MHSILKNDWEMSLWCFALAHSLRLGIPLGDICLCVSDPFTPDEKRALMKIKTKKKETSKIS